jgi:hypothetical protein
MLVAVIIIAIVVVLALAAIAGYFYRGQRLRKRFGPEYDRMVESSGSRFKAEQELRDRERRHRGLTLRELPAEARERYSAEWVQIQAMFVDDPRTATAQADALITRVMAERGYPTEKFDQRAADLSVEHAGTVDRYRRAHELSLRNDQGDADTEELRNALVDYRALVADLLGTNPVPTTTNTTSRRDEDARPVDTAYDDDTTRTAHDDDSTESARDTTRTTDPATPTGDTTASPGDTTASPGDTAGSAGEGTARRAGGRRSAAARHDEETTTTRPDRPDLEVR